MKTKLLLSLSLFAATCVVAMGIPSTAMAASTTYQATLDPLNHSTASGSVTLVLNGDQATITEQVTGMAATFSNAPYPHVQHIHGGALGVCPTVAADKNGDGVISTTEGMPSYGMILTTLSTTGDTSPAGAVDLKIAPSGGSFNYSRTITVSPETITALKAGNAVVVVHGLDPATLSPEAQAAKSDIVPALPLAATSPALCGTLVATQMGTLPKGGVNTGGGSTSGIQDGGLFVLSAGLLLAAGALLVVRRRLSQQS